MNLLEILQKHKANLVVPLPDGVGSIYSSYNACISFDNNKIEVIIYDEDGSEFRFDGDGMDIAWVDTISNFVSDLKQAQSIPEYTLKLPTN